MEIKSEIFNNTLESQVSRNKIVLKFKELIYPSINKSSLLENYSDSEKFIIAFFIYKYIKNEINFKKEIFSTPEILIQSFISSSITKLEKYKTGQYSKFLDIKNKINNLKYIINNFDKIEDLDMENTINFNRSFDLINDEKFSIYLFKNDERIVINRDKINNLRKLYVEIINPILMYFKNKLNIKNSMLLIEQGLNLDTRINSIGYSSIISLNGVTKEEIFKVIEDDILNLDFGLCYLHEKGVYITLPYTSSEGKLILKSIIKK